MPDPDPDAPQGRSDPGKIGPLPIWGWGLVAAGILGFFWWQRSHSAPSATATMSGNDASGGAAPTTDPMTIAELLQQMQALADRQGAKSVSPAPIAPDPAAKAHGNLAPAYSVLATTHTTGGSSTAHVSASHLPDLVTPVIKAIASVRWMPNTQLHDVKPMVQTTSHVGPIIINLKRRAHLFE